MPTYEYECEDCGKRFDYFQSMKDEPLTHCLCCRKGKVKRLLGTGAGIIFKGSGFYCTDYRSPNYREAASKERKQESGKGSGGSAESASAKDTKTGSGDKTGD